jgi:hypothetical protein
MTKHKLILTGGTLLCVLLLAGGALAMSSPNYAINWDVASGGGGTGMSSASYALEGTIGQTGAATGISSSSYGLCLGFWCYGGEYKVFLPLVMRNYSS